MHSEEKKREEYIFEISHQQQTRRNQKIFLAILVLIIASVGSLLIANLPEVYNFLSSLS